MSYHETIEELKWQITLQTLESIKEMFRGKKGRKEALGDVEQEITRLKLEAENEGIVL